MNARRTRFAVVCLGMAAWVCACSQGAQPPPGDAGFDATTLDAPAPSDAGATGATPQDVAPSLDTTTPADTGAEAATDAVTPTDAVACSTCPNGCVVLDTDINNCGSCGFACPTTVPAHAHRTCVAGTCGFDCDTGYRPFNNSCLADCPAGQTACGASCVNLQSDLAHCGACNTPCTLSGGTPICSSGTCVGICPLGQYRCGTVCADLTSDLNHCGTCGTACTGHYSTPTCYNGVCTGICNGYDLDCDHNTANLCETYGYADPNNCGSCGHLCRGATPCCYIGGCTDRTAYPDGGAGACAP